MTETPDGILTAIVYRTGPYVVYLSHSGEPEGLELAEQITVGGKWEEANVLHEAMPPMPPERTGFWTLIWPWRNVRHDLTLPEDERDDQLLACVYLGKPLWQSMTLVPMTPDDR